MSPAGTGRPFAGPAHGPVRIRRHTHRCLGTETSPLGPLARARRISPSSASFRCSPPVQDHEELRTREAIENLQLKARLSAVHRPCRTMKRYGHEKQLKTCSGQRVFSFFIAFHCAWTSARPAHLSIVRVFSLFSAGVFHFSLSVSSPRHCARTGPRSDAARRRRLMGDRREGEPQGQGQ